MLSFELVSVATNVYLQPLFTYIAIVAIIYYFEQPRTLDARLAMSGFSYYLTHVYWCSRLAYQVVMRRMFGAEADIQRENLLVVTEIWLMLVYILAQRMITRVQGHPSELGLLFLTIIFMLYEGNTMEDDFVHRAACMWSITDTCRNVLVLATGVFPKLLANEVHFFTAWNWLKTGMLAFVAYYHIWQYGDQPWYLFIYLFIVVMLTPEITEGVRPVLTMHVPVLPMLKNSIVSHAPRLTAAGELLSFDVASTSSSSEEEEEEEEEEKVYIPPPPRVVTTLSEIEDLFS